MSKVRWRTSPIPEGIGQNRRRWRVLGPDFGSLVLVVLSSGCSPAQIVFTLLAGNDGGEGAGGADADPMMDASFGPDADASVRPDVTVPPPPSEIAPSADCPRGVPSSGNLMGCEYNALGPNQPQPGTLSLMKLRVAGPDGVAAYCLRPHCTVEPGKALGATSPAPSVASVRFGLEKPTGNPWTLDMHFGRAEDGSYTSDGTSGCVPSEITASSPAPGGAYPPFSRLWSCKLFRADGLGVDVDGCVWCTGWDAN